MNYYQTTKKRVFLSFSSDDLDHVRGLRLLNDNPGFDLEFYDQSIKVPVNSHDADYIKSKISDHIRRSSITVCLISETTHASDWVDWELEKSDEYGNTIYAMAVKGVDSAVLPKFIKENNIEFMAWDPDRLSKLLS